VKCFRNHNIFIGNFFFFYFLLFSAIRLETKESIIYQDISIPKIIYQSQEKIVSIRSISIFMQNFRFFKFFCRTSLIND